MNEQNKNISNSSAFGSVSTDVSLRALFAKQSFKKIAFGDNFLLPILGDFRSPSRFVPLLSCESKKGDQAEV